MITSKALTFYLGLSRKNKLMEFPVMRHKDADSDCGVTVPDVPASFSQVSTFSEALDYVYEAFTLHSAEVIAYASTLFPVRDVAAHFESQDHVELSLLCFQK